MNRIRDVELPVTELTPCENPCCGRGYWMPGQPVPPERRQQIEQPRTGRRRRFCSDACRKMVSRENVHRRDAPKARRQLELHQQRRLDEAQSVVTHVLNDMVPINSRVSTTMRKALAERIVRQLALVGRIDLS